MSPTRAQIEKAIGDISIAALRSWLKSQDLPYSAQTREDITERFKKLLDENKLSWQTLEAGITGIEEASAKRITLSTLSTEGLAQLQDSVWFKKNLGALKIASSANALLAPRLPQKAAFVYLLDRPSYIRAKWAETHTAITIDVAKETLVRTKITKIILLLVDKNDGFTQLRFDKPEMIHPHLDEKKKPSPSLYFSHYRAKAEEIVGSAFNSIELRPALRSLVETMPRIVRLPVNDFRTGANSRVRFASRTDIRDDDDWKAMHGKGGEDWAHDTEAIYWLPGASGGRLTREVFSDLDGRTGKLRVEADCYEGEIEYAILKIREHLSKAS